MGGRLPAQAERRLRVRRLGPPRAGAVPRPRSFRRPSALLAEFGGDLSFASEAKALFRHPEARRDFDALGLVEAFTTWSILPDRSAFAVSASSLPPTTRAGARTA